MAHDRDADAQRPPPLGIRARAIAWGGVAITLSIALVVVAVHFLIAALGGVPFTGPNVARDAAVAPTRLRPAPQLERARYFNEEQQRLQEFAWVDREAGIARIPVQAAMELIARGVVNPSVPPGPQPLPTGSVGAAAAATIASARGHVPHPDAADPGASGRATPPGAAARQPPSQPADGSANGSSAEGRR